MTILTSLRQERTRTLVMNLLSKTACGALLELAFAKDHSFYWSDFRKILVTGITPPLVVIPGSLQAMFCV